MRWIERGNQEDEDWRRMVVVVVHRIEIEPLADFGWHR